MQFLTAHFVLHNCDTNPPAENENEIMRRVNTFDFWCPDSPSTFHLLTNTHFLLRVDAQYMKLVLQAFFFSTLVIN